jgi:hypothetical protein
VVAPGIFRFLLFALDGTSVELRHETLIGLSALCGQFGFSLAIPLFRRLWISRLAAKVAQK